MKGEDIYEEGVVLRSTDGKATVSVMGGDACHECGAKLFCSSSRGEENTVEVRDPFGVQAGDLVRFVIRGEAMFRVAGLLYGIPLLLILAGILIGMYLFDPGILPQELWSFVLGLAMAGVYYLGLFLSGESSTASNMPSIVFIRETEHGETA